MLQGRVLGDTAQELALVQAQRYDKHADKRTGCTAPAACCASSGPPVAPHLGRGAVSRATEGGMRTAIGCQIEMLPLTRNLEVGWS